MSDGPRPPTGAFEFTEAQKDRFRALAASVSFVGVCTMLFGGMAVLFAFGAVYSGFAANGAGLAVGALLLLVMAWWTVSAGRSLSGLVVTKGRDVERLMEAVEQLRRLFGFARVAIIVVALLVVGIAGTIVWCTLAVDKGGKCLFW
ncbi:MAG: hypothetical protein ACLP1X_00465 [Polyangiaceae bacterium]|jgi:hypothetical protein